MGATSKISIGVILAVLVAAFWPTWVPLIEKWNGPTYSLGFLVAPICVYLIYRAAAGRTLAPSLSWFGVVVLFSFVAVWLVASTANVHIIAALALPGMAVGGLTALFGTASFLAWLFPVGYLLFAVPVWDALNGVLQTLTIEVNAAVMSAIRVPALIEGSFVHFRTGSFEIASGCAGLHFFVTALAIAALQAYLTFSRWRTRLLFVGLATVLAMLTNWIRVSTIIYAGYVTDMQHYLVTVDHYWYGWVLFLVMLVPLYLLAGLLERREIKAPSASEAADIDDSAVARELPPRNAEYPRLAAVTALLLAGPALGAISDHQVQGVQVNVDIPERLGSWRATSTTAQNYHFVGARDEQARVFRAAGGDLELFVAVYTEQKQGSELISDSNRAFDREIWREAPLAGESELSNAIVLTHRASREKRLLSQTFFVGDHIINDPIRVKLKELTGKLTGTHISGVIAVSTRCETPCALAAPRVKAMLDAASRQHRDFLIRNTVGAESHD